MLDTGMRPAEVFRMRWEHLEWERELIFIPRSKSRKSKRFVGLTARVRAALLAHKTGMNEGWVFPSARAKSGHLETVQKQFERAKRMAGLLVCLNQSCCTVLVIASLPMRWRAPAI